MAVEAAEAILSLGWTFNTKPADKIKFEQGAIQAAWMSYIQKAVKVAEKPLKMV